MGRFQIPKFAEGEIQPGDVNDAFTALATAINNTANGGDSLDGSNFDPSSVPPEGMSAPYTIQVIPVVMDEETVTTGGQNYTGYAVGGGLVIRPAVRVMTDSVLIAYGVHAVGIPGLGGPFPHTMTVLKDGVQIGNGIQFVSDLEAKLDGLTLDVEAGSTLSVQFEMNVGANSNYYLGRAWLFLKVYGWR